MRLYCISDIHSYFVPMKTALDEAGFEPNNSNHLLIVCGDCFDRGPDTKEVLQYLMSIDNKILIKGNHDILFNDMCLRGYPYTYDISNGTVNTACQLGSIDCKEPFDEIFKNAYKKLATYRDMLVPYYETKNYIFVHGFIPLAYGNEEHVSFGWVDYFKADKVYDENWHNSNHFEDAMWLNGIAMAKQGYNQTGKTIVCGHFHCSYGHAVDKGISEFGDDAIWDIYHDDKNKLYAIDRCTAHTGKCNVLVLEDDLIES